MLSSTTDECSLLCGTNGDVFNRQQSAVGKGVEGPFIQEMNEKQARGLEFLARQAPYHNLPIEQNKNWDFQKRALGAKVAPDHNVIMWIQNLGLFKSTTMKQRFVGLALSPGSSDSSPRKKNQSLHDSSMLY